MKFNTYQNRLSQLSARFNLMVCMVLGLLIANFLLSALVWYTSIHQKTIITPFAGVSAFANSDATIDTRDLSQMSENFIYSRLNLTPETCTHQHQRLLTFIDAGIYGAFQARLAKEAQTINASKISSNFIITDMQLDPHKLTATVTGILNRHVGSRELDPSKRTYQITYRYSLSRLSILSFNLSREYPHV